MRENSIGNSAAFEHHVAVKFQLYNSLFLSLPFDRIERTGILLSLFANVCEEGFARRLSPPEIVAKFFADHTSIRADAEKLDLLFRFVQYAERQVVLFDALEDAAFRFVNDLRGAGTLADLRANVRRDNKENDLRARLQDFSVRTVLTAHPTQFYPDSVLGIIHDLSGAIANDEIEEINRLLQQLGRTTFFNKQKPTPFDEAKSLIWYLENVFYDAAGNIASELEDLLDARAQPLKMGFWSGGDRDGNPFVTVETTLQTADALQTAIFRCYLRDVRVLKKRLTFAGVESVLAELEQKLVNRIFACETENDLTAAEILGALDRIKQTLRDAHGNLFAHLVDDLIGKVRLFGTFFAALDIRQESGAHKAVFERIARETNALPADYESLDDAAKIRILLDIRQTIEPEDLSDELARDTLRTVRAVKTIQQRGGATACERYIISQTNSALDVIAVYGLFLLGGWTPEDLTVDIVPLFETVADLQAAANVMRELYECPEYRAHLRRRADKQTIMLGFSDGTKDGGYLAANFNIYRAKAELTAIAEKYKIATVFFDGRGGPPARGGGKTHRFYRSMGAEIADREIELTVQGQTVSSNFGSIEAAQFNLEQLLNAGVYNRVFAHKKSTFTAAELDLMNELAEASFAAYDELKNHPQFLEYLSHVSPLRFYAETNIGSRPAKRSAAGKLALKDLRAIPFVGAWSQLKQNVPGFYGVGAAIDKLNAAGRLDEIKLMYRENQFFKTLLDNCEMALQKSFFPLTEYLAEHSVYAEIYRKVRAEYDQTARYLLEISGKSELMADYPIEKHSIQMRERTVLPLTTIQQFALARLRESEETNEQLESATKTALEKIVMRCSFGIINAGRNAA